MLKFKLTWASLIVIIALIVYALVLFLSVNFIADVSSLYTKPILYSLSLGFIAFLLAGVKRARGNFSQFLLIEWGLLALFVGMALWFLPYFAHFFNISDNKTGVQNALLMNLSKADSVWINYDRHVKNRIQCCESDMKSAFALHNKGLNNTHFNNFVFKNGVSQNVQIKTQLNNLSKKLMPGNYAGDKSSDSASIESARVVVQEWKALGLPRINSMFKEFAEKANYFQEVDTFKLRGEKPCVSFTYTPNYVDLSTYYTTVNKPTAMPTIYAILLYILMLLSWLVAERNFKSPGMLFFFRKGMKNDETEITID
jgi:hypothetical protein